MNLDTLDLADLAQKLLPFLLDGLKNNAESHANTSSTPLQKVDKHGMYLPEVDYLCWYAKHVGMLKTCGYRIDKKRGNRSIRVGYAASADAPLGLYLVGGHGDARVSYLFPVSLLHSFIGDVYEMDYLLDYRFTKDSRTMYMKGIFDGSKVIERNACVRTIDYNTPITQQIIDNTRAYWSHPDVPEDGGRSIVTKATMMELLDNFEIGLLTPGQVPWHIDITNRNNMPEVSLQDMIAGIIPEAPAINPVSTIDLPPALLKEPKKISIARNAGGQ